MIHDETLSVKPLHDLYCRLSGRPQAMTMQCVFGWRAFQAHGWGEEELRLVIPLVHKKIKMKQKWNTALSIRLLLDEENFAEYLSEARAEARIPKVNHGLNQVLLATSRPTKQEEVKVTVRTPEQVLAESQAFQKFKQWRAESGL